MNFDWIGRGDCPECATTTRAGVMEFTPTVAHPFGEPTAYCLGGCGGAYRFTEAAVCGTKPEPLLRMFE